MKELLKPKSLNVPQHQRTSLPTTSVDTRRRTYQLEKAILKYIHHWNRLGKTFT